MKKIKKILTSIMLVCAMIVTSCCSMVTMPQTVKAVEAADFEEVKVADTATETAIKAAGDDWKYKGYYKYIYPEDAAKAGIPEYCFSTISGNHKVYTRDAAIAKDGADTSETGYYVWTQYTGRDSDGYKCLQSYYIAWTCTYSPTEPGSKKFWAKAKVVASNEYYRLCSPDKKDGNGEYLSMVQIDLKPSNKSKSNPDTISECRTCIQGQRVSGFKSSYDTITQCYTLAKKAISNKFTIQNLVDLGVDMFSQSSPGNAGQVTIEGLNTNYFKNKVEPVTKKVGVRMDFNNTGLLKKGHYANVIADTYYSSKKTPKKLRLSSKKKRYAKVKFNIHVRDMLSSQDVVYSQSKSKQISYVRAK